MLVVEISRPANMIPVNRSHCIYGSKTPPLPTAEGAYKASKEIRRSAFALDSAICLKVQHSCNTHIEAQTVDLGN
jgi:hypothetical protein